MVFRTIATAVRARSSDIALRAMAPDATARAAGFGRWWYDAHFGALVLSLEAGVLLGEAPGVHADLADCFSSVLPEDLVLVTTSLAAGHECEFRILNRNEGLRWLRLVALPCCRTRRTRWSRAS